MRSAASVALLCLCAAPAAHAAAFTYHVAGPDAGSWPELFEMFGLKPTAAEQAAVVVAAGGAGTPKAAGAALVILEGASRAAEELGFRATDEKVAVRSVIDARAPELGIVWEEAVTVPRFTVPAAAAVFARERWTGAPLLAGLRRGAGAVLWIATAPGPRAYSRYPYLAQALADLGFEPPFRSARLWAFFDSAYRARVDLDYFAPRWRAAGIAALHVAAWHYWERDPQADAYLARLIEACHRNAIQVYAWLELPHVSERFWAEHPEWREKTALGQDAHLDWRKLINLTNRGAFAAVAAGARDLIARFDWDGVNLAELYFESLEGHENPARFTPFNADVRAEFLAAEGFDPVELFDPSSPRAAGRAAVPLARFLDFRAALARRQQAEWIGEIEGMRATKPWLDLALTHVDDRFDTSMREKIGADAARTLPLLDSHDFTFLVEDPATIWNLGPQRYPQIAARYRELTRHAERLGIDINVVERYQDVYPTKQQTGLELFELVHTAAEAFPRVALYFESSIPRRDWPLLSHAAAVVRQAAWDNGRLVVDSPRGVAVAWDGPALVDGRVWPAASGRQIWLPTGAHSIEPAVAEPPLRLVDFNGELKSAAAVREGIEFSYESGARAMAVFDRAVARMEIDGAEARVETAGAVWMLPRGQHLVAAYR
jgi:hypothetical protein